MTATVTPKSYVPGGHQAWCAEHADGVNGSKTFAQQWADAHNKKHHQPTGESK